MFRIFFNIIANILGATSGAKHWFVKAVDYAPYERHGEAIEAFKQTIRMNPDYPEAHYYLGVAYAKLGNTGAALEEYKILKSIDSEPAGRFTI